MATTTATQLTQKRPFNFEALLQSFADHPENWLLAFAFVGGFFYLAYRSHWNAALFQNVNATNIVGFLTPLIITAAVIERAVEVVISPWRDKDADQMRSAIDNASKLASAAPDDAAASTHLQAVTDDFSQYTGQTRRYAYALAVVFGVIAVTGGVRALWPMLDTNTLKNLPTDQQSYFRWFDMLVSALLLAGGAAGIHAPINAFTSFFQKNP